MTEPEQVSVNVADLRALVDVWQTRGEPWWPQGAMGRLAVVAYPKSEPEWDLTDAEQVAQDQRTRSVRQPDVANLTAFPNDREWLADITVREAVRDGQPIEVLSWLRAARRKAGWIIALALIVFYLAGGLAWLLHMTGEG